MYMCIPDPDALSFLSLKRVRITVTLIHFESIVRFLKDLPLLIVGGCEEFLYNREGIIQGDSMLIYATTDGAPIGCNEKYSTEWYAGHSARLYWEAVPHSLMV